MPKSKSRSQAGKPGGRPQGAPTPQKVEVNPRWLVPTFLTLMIAGLIWIVVTYLLRFNAPIPGVGAWNLAVGFVLLISGFMLTTRWR